MTEDVVDSSEKVMIELIQMYPLAGAFAVLLIIVLVFIYMMWRHSGRRDDVAIETQNKQIEILTLITARVDELVRRCHNKIGADVDETPGT